MMPSRFRRFALCLPLACAAALLATAPANAGVVTIGSPLRGEFDWPTLVTQSGTFVPTSPGRSESQLVSTVDGAVIRWRIRGQFAGGPVKLQVVRPAGSGNYSGGPISAPESPAGGGTRTFSTSLPIKAGEGIGVIAEAGSEVGVHLEADSAAEYTTFPVLGGSAESGSQSPRGEELGLNADILPAPTVAGLSPTSGPAAGGTKVTITGANFVQVSKVSFGSVAATSFKVEAEGKLTATVPARVPSKTVAVSVTTVAGTATAATKFTYAAKSTAAGKPGKGKAGKGKKH